MLNYKNPNRCLPFIVILFWICLTDGDSIFDMRSASSAPQPDTFIISLPVLQLHRQVHNSTTAFSTSSVTERDSLASSLTPSCFLIKWLLVDFSLVDTAYSSRYCYLESMRAPPLIKALSLRLQLYLFNSLLGLRVFSQQEAPWDGTKYLFFGGTGRMYTHYSDASEFLVLSMMAACESTLHQNSCAISSVPSKCIFFPDVMQFLIQRVTATSLQWLCHGSVLHHLSLDEGA